MSLSLPSNPTRANCDAGTDDPKLALLTDLYNHVGTTIDFLAAMGNLATKQFGNGLAVEAQAAGTADKVHVAIATAAKTGAYTAVAADRGKLIDCTSGTFTLSLTAAATLGDGWYFIARNSGTGLITIDPNGAELIDGQTTLALPPGFAGVIQCTGSAFKTTIISVTLLSALTAPGAADELMIYDASAGSTLKITLENLFKAIDALTAETTTATGDEILLYDVSATVARKMTLANMLAVLNSLTEDTSPDTGADFLLSYDTSAGAVKKVKPTNIASSGISTDVGVGGVGVIRGMLNLSGSTVTAGGTVAGSGLSYGSVDPNGLAYTTYNGTPAGTWRNISGPDTPNADIATSTYGLFQRIS